MDVTKQLSLTAIENGTCDLSRLIIESKKQHPGLSHAILIALVNAKHIDLCALRVEKGGGLLMVILLRSATQRCHVQELGLVIFPHSLLWDL